MTKIALSFGFLFALSGAVQADSSVKVTNVHLCCGACYSGVEKAVKTVDGATVTFEKAAKTVTLAGKDDATVQKALDAMVAAGYHGMVSGDKFKVVDDSGVSSGKVKSVTFTGIHNCCGACNKQIQAAIKKVEGVTGDTAKVRAESFDVTGDFNAADVVKSLNAAGFHVKVKK